MSTLTRCTQSWWLMHGLIGCIWMTLTSLNSLRYYVRESSGMSSRNVRPRRGKECSHRGSQCHSCCLEADERLDFMQRQRQFWPTMTTRHASLAPIELGTFRRERRLMQSKHLWDTFSIDWYKLDSKLHNAKPTGHSRELLWNYLFVQKHRQNPFQEREYQGHDAKNVYNKWCADQRHMKAYQSTKTLRGIDVDAAMMGFNIENLTAKQALMDAKDKHARRWQTHGC